MTSNLALILSDRIADAYPVAAILSADAFDETPSGVLHALIAARIIQQAARASTIHCQGCERYCHKPVTVRRQPGSLDYCAYVTCDEEPRHGRIPVANPRLVNYRSSLGLVEKFLERRLASTVPLQRQVNDQVAASTIKGRYGTRTVCLAVEGQQTVVRVGAETAPLAQVLLIGESDVELDIKLLRRLANRKRKRTSTDEDTRRTAGGTRSGSCSQGDRDRQILRDALRLRRDEGLNWSKAAERIAAMDFVRDGSRNQRPIKASTIRRILARMRSVER